MATVRGVYALILALDRDTVITIGKLATSQFARGYYLYTGSALGSLFPRVRRHIQGNGKLHWHIDYLRRQVGIVEVWYTVADRWSEDNRLECIWYQAATGMPYARSLLAGFGSSDCNCYSHLVYFTVRPSFELFEHQLRSKGLELRKIYVGSKH